LTLFFTYHSCTSLCGRGILVSIFLSGIHELS